MPKQQQLLSAVRGFTLIELLIVISLVGLLMGWSVPEFMKFNRRQVHLGAADQLVTDLKLAQNLAESGVRGEDVDRYRLHWIDVNTYQVWSCQDQVTPLVKCQTSTTLKAKDLDAEVSVSDASPPLDVVDFLVPTGNVSDDAVEYTVCHSKLSGEMFRVTVEKGGRIFRGEREVGC